MCRRIHKMQGKWSAPYRRGENIIKRRRHQLWKNLRLLIEQDAVRHIEGA